MKIMNHMSAKYTPKPETKLKQWYVNQKESTKGMLALSRTLTRKYSGHMFVVSSKPNLYETNNTTGRNG